MMGYETKIERDLSLFLNEKKTDGAQMTCSGKLFQIRVLLIKKDD